VLEFSDHLHEHFIDELRVEHARYLLPTIPGYVLGCVAIVVLKQAAKSLRAFDFTSVVAGWINREQQKVVAYLWTENPGTSREAGQKADSAQ